MARMKDDERALLAHCQAGRPPGDHMDMQHGRMVQLLKKWATQGWVDPSTGKLTAKGMAQKPTAQAVAPEPPADEPPADDEDEVEVDDVVDEVDDDDDDADDDQGGSDTPVN